VRRSVARETLETATFFLAHAERVGYEDREALQRCASAVIVFGRSVTFHIQKEFGNDPAFSSWYERVRERLGSDRVCAFFLEARNVVLKERLLEVNQEVSITLGSTVELDSALEVKVIRGSPWYRRRPGILWEDFRRSLLSALRRRWSPVPNRLRRKRGLKRHLDTSQSTEIARRFFMEPFPDDSAFDLLHHYLDAMARVVDEAESRFT
jgi:hypothetical protein